MTNKIGGRPNQELQKQMGRTHYQGKQFRYCYLLCSKKEKKKLLSSSTVIRWLEHPKELDLQWKIQTNDGYVSCNKPFYYSKRRVFELSSNWIAIQSLF